MEHGGSGCGADAASVQATKICGMVWGIRPGTAGDWLRDMIRRASLAAGPWVSLAFAVSASHAPATATLPPSICDSAFCIHNPSSGATCTIRRSHLPLRRRPCRLPDLVILPCPEEPPTCPPTLRLSLASQASPIAGDRCWIVAPGTCEGKDANLQNTVWDAASIGAPLEHAGSPKSHQAPVRLLCFFPLDPPALRVGRRPARRHLPATIVRPRQAAGPGREFPVDHVTYEISRRQTPPGRTRMSPEDRMPEGLGKLMWMLKLVVHASPVLCPREC